MGCSGMGRETWRFRPRGLRFQAYSCVEFLSGEFGRNLKFLELTKRRKEQRDGEGTYDERGSRIDNLPVVVKGGPNDARNPIDYDPNPGIGVIIVVLVLGGWGLFCWLAFRRAGGS